MADPRTWVDGEVVGPADLNAELRDRLLAIHNWTTYTPTWTASGGTPAIGDGSLTGRYRVYGHVCDVQITLTFGSTTSVGTTTVWQFGLPVAVAVAGVMAAVAVNVGSQWFSCAAFHSGFGLPLQVAVPAGGIVGYSVPFTWGPGDYLRITGSYEV